MSVLPPPASIGGYVDRLLPGIYRRFFNALVSAHQGASGRVSSFWRDPAHNREVGGNAASQHLLGLAIDIVYPDDANRRRGISGMRSSGLTVIDEGDHVHAQVFPSGHSYVGALLRTVGLA